MWALDGTMERVFTALLAQADAVEDRGFDDRACTPARRRGRKRVPAGELHDHAIGLSRGGLTTKIHLASDARCWSLVT
ncbi:hypothetical protein ACIRPT_40405 [Streptomyces sp. NPDC101227]|uniref:hypothetical protein n=1 Tax=Streptomyces sp. NPDC101227 TaxID=3366136 RepID=UPI00380399E3